MSIVDKSRAGLGLRQFHIDVAPGEVSTVALLPGDPFRVPLVAEYLEGAREVAHKREHRTMVGSYKGRDVTVTSTGMGCPSTAIAVEDYRAGKPVVEFFVGQVMKATRGQANAAVVQDAVKAKLDEVVRG